MKSEALGQDVLYDSKGAEGPQQTPFYAVSPFYIILLPYVPQTLCTWHSHTAGSWKFLLKATLQDWHWIPLLGTREKTEFRAWHTGQSWSISEWIFVTPNLGFQVPTMFCSSKIQTALLEGSGWDEGFRAEGIWGRNWQAAEALWVPTGVQFILASGQGLTPSFPPVYRSASPVEPVKAQRL